MTTPIYSSTIQLSQLEQQSPYSAVSTHNQHISPHSQLPHQPIIQQWSPASNKIGDTSGLKERTMEIEMSPEIQPVVTRRKSMCLNIIHENECPICLKNVPNEELMSFTKCQHRYCAKCAIKLSKEEIENLQMPKCPSKDCNSLLNKMSVILTYLTADELEKLEEIENKMEIKRKHITEVSINIETSEKEPQQQRMRSRLQENLENGQKNQNLQNNSQKLQLSSSMGLTDSVATNHAIVLEELDGKSPKQKVQIKQGVPVKPSSALFPKRLFNLVCTKMWSDKWFNFFKILPISIIAMVFLVLLSVLWAIWVFLYFVAVWLLFVPLLWALFEIWGCLSRSIQSLCFRKFAFGVLIFLFPLLLIFFYLLTMMVILWDGLSKADMKKVLKGKTSLLMRCSKVYLNLDRRRKQCRCRISEECEICQNRSRLLCLVF